MHGFIKFINNQFILTDNNSKFGTLVKLRKTLTLQKEKIAFQAGRNVISLSQKKNNDGFSFFDNIDKKQTLDLKEEILDFVDKNSEMK